MKYKSICIKCQALFEMLEKMDCEEPCPTHYAAV